MLQVKNGVIDRSNHLHVSVLNDFYNDLLRMNAFLILKNGRASCVWQYTVFFLIETREQIAVT